MVVASTSGRGIDVLAAEIAVQNGCKEMMCDDAGQE